MRYGFAPSKNVRLFYRRTTRRGSASATFRTVEKRPPLLPANYTPRIGVGDLLRYNAGVPRPITVIYPIGLFDLTGDGKRDLVGCWNYFYRAGDPLGGVVFYPRVGSGEKMEFGDLTRMRYVANSKATKFNYFFPQRPYLNASAVDLNGDGLLDVACLPGGQGRIYFYLNAGKRDAGGTPVFVAAGSVALVSKRFGTFNAVDLDKDGALDFVVGNKYYRNTNAKGWPVTLAEPVSLACGYRPCFYDVDGDGALDAVGQASGRFWEPSAHRLVWRKNLRTDPPTFGKPQALADIDEFWCTSVAPVNSGRRRGLLVGHDIWQSVSFYEQLPDRNGKPRFKKFGRAESVSAVMSLSDQASPFVCDWDGDGDLDLLVGGGYGWPRIVINEGTTERPAYAEPRLIEADGKPIRLLRNDILGRPYHGHNMGYPYPTYVDWDMDGLPDLVIANETNRIFWYKNTGTRRVPKFGKRRQILVDGYPDSPELRAQSARRAKDPKSNNGCYPYEKEQPFHWRIRGSYVDLTAIAPPTERST